MRARFFVSGIAIAVLPIAVCFGQTDGKQSRPHIEVERQSEVPDKFLDLPPLPKSNVTLIGGTVARMDPIHDRMVVRAFGGKDVVIDFDVRTAVLKGTTPSSTRELRSGTRIYADTILNNGRIFAKTVRIENHASSGETRGQVTGYDPAKKLLRVRDVVSSHPFELRINGLTEIRANGRPVDATQLIDGTLVHVVFRSGLESVNSAQKIDVLAQPGSSFTFSGRVAVVDLRDQHLTLAEADSDNTFEVGLKSLAPESKARLREGMDVVVRAKFDGNRYEAESVELKPAASPQ